MNEQNWIINDIKHEITENFSTKVRYTLKDETKDKYKKHMELMLQFLDNLKEDETSIDSHNSTIEDITMEILSSFRPEGQGNPFTELEQRDREDILPMIEFLDGLKKSKDKMKTWEKNYIEKTQCNSPDRPSGTRPTSLFTKDDSGKPRFNLLPESAAHVIDSSIMKMFVIALTSKSIDKLLDLSEYLVVDLWDVVEVLTHGANKYSDNNWKTAKDNNRYWSALGRHLHAYDLDHNSVDEDSGFTHGAHAMCNIIFLLDLVSKQSN